MRRCVGKTRDFPTLATLKYTGDESPLRTIFDTMYKVMARSNWVIQELLKKGKSTTLSDIEREVSVKLTSLVDGLIS